MAKGKVDAKHVKDCQGAATLAWTLPYPHGVTANHLYRGNPRSRQLTPEHQAFRNHVIAVVRDGGMPQAPAGRLTLLLDVFTPDETRRDLDNLIKATQDALAAALEIDDKRIYGLAAMKFLDRENPRIEATLIPLGAWGPLRARQWLTGDAQGLSTTSGAGRPELAESRQKSWSTRSTDGAS